MSKEDSDQIWSLLFADNYKVVASLEKNEYRAGIQALLDNHLLVKVEMEDTTSIFTITIVIFLVAIVLAVSFIPSDATQPLSS